MPIQEITHIENAILENIDKLDNLQSTQKSSAYRLGEYTLNEEIKQHIKNLFTSCLGATTHTFIHEPKLQNYISKQSDLTLKLWFELEKYLQSNDNEERKIQLQLIESILKETMKEFINSKEQKTGEEMLPEDISKPVFIRSIYMLNDRGLHDLFLQYLPPPRENMFKQGEIPSLLKERFAKSKKDVDTFLSSSAQDKHSPQEKEKLVMNMQRLVRKKQRMKQDIKRIAKNYEISEKQAEAIIKEASLPYHPKCDKDLSKRIMSMTKDIILYTEVRHITDHKALQPIFDDALYGRKTLENFYMNYVPAALGGADITEGDLNVICLGTNKIDEPQGKDIELIFDLKKISTHNPSVLYKQRDFHFGLTNTREIKIGDDVLRFRHTLPTRSSHTRFDFRFPTSDPKNLSAIKTSLLVSYNVKNMHQILILNFFRYLDETKGDEKRRLYEKLSTLNDDELKQVLSDIGKNISDTMEFNFYGAHRIDFSTLKEIRDTQLPFTINIQTLINELNTGNLEPLTEATEKLPQVFKSHRFVDYLLESTSHEESHKALSDIRRGIGEEHNKKPS